MSTHAFVLSICIMTVASHIGLLFLRGWLISECRREQRKQYVEWDAWKEEQEKWRSDFEERHPTWMTKKRTA